MTTAFSSQHPADLIHCADEPIRIPGAIQPHGRLVALTANNLALAAFSANWATADEARGAVTALSAALRGLTPNDAPAPLGRLEVAGRPWDAAAHANGTHVFVELEAPTAGAGLEAPIYTLARHSLPLLQRTQSIDAVSRFAVDEMKRLTGFGRCLIYRFDSAGHGEVLAETIDAGYDSYAGHHFPADDIPAQARALYVQSHIRLIADANYTPVPLLAPGGGGIDAASVDLSMASLRSVSPVHLEYMRNMGTLASMSVSIVVGGELWGLISCHDHAPRHLGLQTRVACEHLGRLVALHVEALESNADVAARLALREITLELVAALSDSDATLRQLVDHPAALLGLARASGAAVLLDDVCWTAGETPDVDTVRQLADWLGEQGPAALATDRLAERWPPAQALQSLAAGVMAISISQVHRHLILWFRPEIVRTIQWAGEPRKSAVREDGRIHPRKSFAGWQEHVRGRSLPWTEVELAATAELRQALVGIVLKRAEELAEVAGELARVNKELEAFSYTVSHDLRAPMRHISGYVDLVLDADGDGLSPQTHRYLGHVKDASAYAGQLVDALLNFSRLGRSALKREPIDTNALVRDLVRQATRNAGGRPIEWKIAPDLPALEADPFLLQVVLRNLLSNAVKYSSGREPAVIEIRPLALREGVGVEVQDNGVGFQMEYVNKLFGVFQRLHQAEDFEGTGIGLATLKRIVERHGGSVFAQGEPDHGATFGFVLPPPSDKTQHGKKH